MSTSVRRISTFVSELEHHREEVVSEARERVTMIDAALAALRALSGLNGAIRVPTAPHMPEKVRKVLEEQKKAPPASYELIKDAAGFRYKPRSAKKVLVPGIYRELVGELTSMGLDVTTERIMNLIRKRGLAEAALSDRRLRARVYQGLYYRMRPGPKTADGSPRVWVSKPASAKDGKEAR